MDIPITRAKKSKLRLFKEFEYIDLIPYSISLLMLLGDVYLIIIYTRLAHIGIN